MLNLTFLTGAGISHASGLALFNGPEHTLSTNSHAFSNTDLDNKRHKVIAHYNERLRCIIDASPSDAHYLITALQEHYKVRVITQNIDNLHERAGSNEVIHIHGQLTNRRTDANCCHRYNSHHPIHSEETCHHGSPWRHDVVLYGESLKHYEQARRVLALTDVLVVVGCSMQANAVELLLAQVHQRCPIYFINPFPQCVPTQAYLIKQPAYQGIWTAISSLSH